MALFKCKMCGGTIEFEKGNTVGLCDSCGTKQTLPKTNDDVIANLFNRANNLRLKCEFDKAAQIYEKIVEQDDSEAEAHWGIVLCKYGIEYVEDPKTFKRIPTCHRTLYQAILADHDYQSAIDYSDSFQQIIYESEARAIDKIQKDILAIVKNEKPFDVFICYKETDENGKRTVDSTIANDIYYQLTQEGFKVFFAAITLEDKLGQEYEPYIFAALNSAKVMLVIGTKPEYFSSVWVKNEWSRYLQLMKSNRSKLLIPCYRDMDAYDLPEEFAHLQAQNMGKIGFVNDVIRGIKKVIQNDEKEEVVVKESIDSVVPLNISPLLERAAIFLEDEKWTEADDYCEKVLDQSPKNAQAYIYKLMATIHVRKQEDLINQILPFDDNDNYQKAVRFADEQLRTALTSYIEHINTRNDNARLEEIYTRAKNAMSTSNTESAYKEAARLFESISEYQDSAALAQSCYEKAEEEKKRAEEEKKRCDELYKEYKAAVENEKSGVDKKAEANKKLSTLDKEHNNLVALKNSWQGIEDELFSLNERMKPIESEIASLTNEKAKLGLFAGKRKKEIAERIAVLESNQRSLMGDIAFLQKEKQEYNTLSEVESKINRIIQQIEEQKSVIEELSSTRSSQTIRDELNAFAQGEKILQRFDFSKNIKVGKYITFGTYEQDNNKSNGPEDIEWLVLEVKDGKALVISKYALDSQRYNTSYTYVTWKTCTLRKWLNNDFINAAFSADEKAMIPTVTVSADKNPGYSTDPGNATQDQVFLLSIPEANKYFNSDSARQCKPTDYAVANGAYVYSDKGNCCWWLRSPGYDQDVAARVFIDGDVLGTGTYVSRDNYAVRPALWIDLNA